MRLWTLHPCYLDARGLVALWREALLARKVLAGQTRGYRSHPQLERFRQASDPLVAIDSYLAEIWAEAARRGYRFDAGKIGAERLASQLDATSGQLAYEWTHLRAKLALRDPARLAEFAEVAGPLAHPLFHVVAGGVASWEKTLSMHGLPYWRLSGFYFFYFAFVGAMAPFWGLYLKSLEFNAFEIGVLMSLFQVMRIFAPNAWGWLADHLGRRVMIVQIAASLSLACFLGMFFVTDFWPLFLVMSLISFFWSASLPLVEATTLSHLGDKTAKYGRIRLWGSVGFVISVIGLGYILDFTPIRTLLWAILGIMIGLTLLSRHIPEAAVVPHAGDHLPLWHVLRRPAVLAFFIGGFLMAAAHGPYYTFYSIYLVDHGYSKSSVGLLWSLGVLMEIGIFLWVPRLTRRFTLRQMLLASFACAVLRFLMIGWGVGYVAVVLVAQMLHAVTFGVYHAAAVEMVHRFFRGKHQSRGQALYNSFTFGAGGTLGGLYAGMVWDGLGPALTFTIAAGCALAAWLLVAWHSELEK